MAICRQQDDDHRRAAGHHRQLQLHYRGAEPQRGDSSYTSYPAPNLRLDSAAQLPSGAVSRPANCTKRLAGKLRAGVVGKIERDYRRDEGQDQHSDPDRSCDCDPPSMQGQTKNQSGNSDEQPET